MKENEEILKLISFYSRDLIALHEITGEFAFITPNCRSFLDYSQEDLLGHNLFEFLHPNDLYEVMMAYNNLRQFSASTKIQYRIRKKDMTYTWFESVISELKVPGESHPARIISISRDITDKKNLEHELNEVEEKWKFIRECSSDNFWDLDLNIMQTENNKKLMDILGLGNNEKEPASILWGNMVHMEDKEKIKSAVLDHLEGKTELFEIEHRLLTKTNDWKWVLMRGRVTAWDGKTPLRISGTHKDITDKKRYEDDMLSFKKSESIAILTGGIAHDFSNLLTTIIGNISILKIIIDKGDKEKIHRILGNMEKASLSAKELTQGLLKVSQGRIIPKLPGSIDKIIYAAAKESIRQKNISNEFILANDLFVIELNEEQLIQALGNVLTNSVEAMPNGGKITIRAENIEIKEDEILTLKPGKYVKLQISDEGLGIPKGHLSQIFDPYFTTKVRSNEKGSGLGLAMTHSIIRNHNGHIIASSEIEKGTTMTIYLPASGKNMI
jgi:two-component system, cell cycle sensor histidine kinase and response regulator CckA